MHIRHQVHLARTVEILAIDVCCSQNTTDGIANLLSLPSPSLKFHLQLSRNPEHSASGVANGGLVLSEKAKVALFDRIPVGSQLMYSATQVFA